MHSKSTITSLFFISVSTYLFATNVYVPSMPAMVTYFKTSEDLVQMTVATFLLGAAISAFCSGAIIDRIGQRPVMLWGMATFLLFSCICIFSPTIELLLAARFFQGSGAGLAPVIGFAAIQDIYPPKQSAKILAWLGIGFAVTPSIAPVLGGHIDVLFGWKGNFLFVAILALVTYLGSHFFFQNTRELAQDKTLSFGLMVKNYAKILTNKKFLGYSLLVPLLYSGEWCYVTTLPFYFINLLGMAPNIFGYYIGTIVLGFGIGSYFATRLMHTQSMEKTIMIGACCAIFGSLSVIASHFLTPDSPTIICLGLFIFLTGQGLLFSPSTTLSLRLFDNMRASASSIRSTLIILIGGLGTVAAGFFNDYTILPLSLYLLTVSSLALVAFLMGKRSK